MTIEIDLSKGWDIKEITKLINNLPIDDITKLKMENENRIFGEIDKALRRG